MHTDLTCKARQYFEAFNATDRELYPQTVTNADAPAFLCEQIPFLDCPDAELEKTYYFRWWTLRKHIRRTPDGYIFTEFLPPVKWAGKYNSIVCPVGFHSRESRWMKSSDRYTAQCLQFWLDGKGDVLKYSSWLCHAVWEYCELNGDFSFAVRNLPNMVRFFRAREEKQRRSCGLYWSNDGRDGMEYSISGSGLRPTLNSYVYADARAIARTANAAGDAALAREFDEIADALREKTDALLWDGEFYRVIPLAETDDPVLTSRPSVAAEHNARELLGYIPWYFGIPSVEKSAAFSHLLNGFSAPCGLTTAEKQHPRFMEPHPHECLWNGPSWPFATSQTLVAVAELLRGSKQTVLDRNDYYRLLSQYARAHRICTEDGRVLPWIDEELDPFSGKWLTRDILEKAGWPEKKGGFERGKDYNHSLFCDLVLSGLLGIGVSDGKLTVEPLLPTHWNYFRVENLWVNGGCYAVTYDKDGAHYGGAAGITITGG